MNNAENQQTKQQASAFIQLLGLRCWLQDNVNWK